LHTITITTTYGNGYTTSYTRAIGSVDTQNHHVVLDDEAERERQRNKNFKGRFMQRGMSFYATHVVTLTTTDVELMTDGKALLDKAKAFFKASGVTFICILELHPNSDNLHIHALTDGEVDLYKWNSSVPSDMKNLYCDVFYNDDDREGQYVTLLYMLKSIEDTKEKYPVLSRYWLSNAKKVKKRTSVVFDDVAPVPGVPNNSREQKNEKSVPLYKYSWGTLVPRPTGAPNLRPVRKKIRGSRKIFILFHRMKVYK